MRLARRRALGIATVVVATALAALHPRPDLGTLPILPFVVTTAVVASLGIVALLVATSARSFAGPSARVLIAIAIFAPPLYALTTAATPLRSAAEAPAPPAWMCLMLGAAIASAGLAALVAAFRFAVPVAPRARGAALGAAAGAWAGLAMHLRCPSADPVHIVLGHAMPIMIVAAVGALAAPRFLRP